MNKDEINRAIANAVGQPMFVMLKQGAYYRPGASGYTMELSEAGQWPENEARRLECSKGYPDEVKAIPAPSKDYTGCLNACHEMVATLDGSDKIHFTSFLYSVAVAKEYSFADHFIGWPQAEMLANATAPQRCEAFLRALGLWQSEPPTPEATRG